MATLAHRRARSAWPEMFDWLETGFPTLWRAASETQAIRIEDDLQEDRYVLRAELPGFDPEKDIEIGVEEGMLSIKAERSEERKVGQRSEFHYGSFARRVTLPAGAREDDISAEYKDGILEVVVPIEATARETHRVPIQRKE